MFIKTLRMSKSQFRYVRWHPLKHTKYLAFKNNVFSDSFVYINNYTNGLFGPNQKFIIYV